MRLFCIFLVLIPPYSTLLADGVAAFFEVQQADEAAFESIDPAPAFSWTRMTAGLEGFIRNGPTQFSWRLSAEHIGTDWNRRDVLPGQGTDLFDDVQTLEATGIWVAPIRGSLGYWLFGGLESSRAAESPFRKADWSDAFSANLGAALTYQFSRDLVAGLGFMYLGAPADLEENWIPILQLYWKINERWTLQTQNGVIVEWAPQAPSALREVRFLALWQGPAWHLGSDEGGDWGYEQEGWMLRLEADWQLTDRLSVVPFIRYDVAREAEIRQSGNTIVESDLEDVASIGATVKWTF